MVEGMPRPRPPHLHKEFTRHDENRPIWYVRVNKGPRIRLRSEFGTDAFWKEYHAAVDGGPTKPKTEDPTKPSLGTLGWALALYRQSIPWGKLSPATRRQRDNIFKHVLKNGGAKPLKSITKKVIFDNYQSHAATPNAARNFLDAMRGLMRWAVTASLIDSDPTAEIKASKPKSDGFLPWSADDLVAFYKRWPIGTRERLACDVLLYTGLRRGDAVRFGRPHIKDGIAEIQTEKTGQWAYFLMEPELLDSIAASPCGELTFIAGERGRPMAKESFGNWFSSAARTAGIKKSAHGLRKSGATRDAERGFTESELEAKYAWDGGQMAARYTKAVNRKRLAVGAARRANEPKPKPKKTAKILRLDGT